MTSMLLVAIDGEQFAVVALIIVTLTYFFHKKGSLDYKGMLLADFFGIIAFALGGLSAFIACMVTFLFAEVFTRFGRRNKAEKFEKRTTQNIIGNGLPAMIALVLGQHPAFFGALSAALADTASSEIGMLSGKKPRLITTLQKVERGTDGGITLLGLGAALGASLVMAVSYYYLRGNQVHLLAILLAGITGSLVDSLLGAVLERKGKLNNMQVNFIASSAGGLLVYALTSLT
ncbi:MAG: DUF92 domain-containing protein [Candidatus Diapherotrites archaeon]|uniref:DUF92 domain-containing protein n=1 Tax=Candidatus Iainarchaeum sp. TaxID=3101447 RepID=A0A8T4LAU3_9ARCH|nr:DUF92 domain-containing protein [Candidatus Diapherotrites archaeon]